MTAAPIKDVAPLHRHGPCTVVSLECVKFMHCSLVLIVPSLSPGCLDYLGTLKMLFSEFPAIFLS